MIAQDLVKVEGELSARELEQLKGLAAQRGLSPNEVLRQALATEVLLAEAVNPGDRVLIHGPDNTTR